MLRRRDVLAGLGVASSYSLLSHHGWAKTADATGGAPQVAMISTSVGWMPDGKPTGLWMAELTTPYWAFMDAGFEVRLASVAGGAPPVDERSMAGPRGRGVSVDRFERSSTAMARFQSMPAVAALDPSRFNAVFLCGGHGTMWDFCESAGIRRVVENLDRRGAVVAAVCHGPAGLLTATRPDGSSILAGRRATGFTNAEEDAVQLTASMPYLLETVMKRLGARFEATANFQPFAVRDGNLITGQNPASAAPIAELVVAALRETTRVSR